MPANIGSEVKKKDENVFRNQKERIIFVWFFGGLRILSKNVTCK